MKNLPPHIIIGESHYDPTGIKLALALLPFMPGKVVLCLEHPYQTSKEIIADYRLRKTESDHLDILSRGDTSTYEKMKNLYSEHIISERLFGKNCINAYIKLCDYLEKNHVTFYGIDKPNPETSGPKQVSERSIYMMKKLIEISQENVSTITVVGNVHAFDIYKAFGHLENFYCCIVPQDVKQFTCEPYYNESIKTLFNRIFHDKDTKNLLDSFKQLYQPYSEKKNIDFFENKSLEDIISAVSSKLNLTSKSSFEQQEKTPITSKNIFTDKKPQNKLDTVFQKYKITTLDKEKALRNAALNGEKDDVIYLISQGANINTPDTGNKLESKRTALHHAVIKKHYHIVEILLENNAQFNIKDNSQKTAEDYIDEKDEKMLALFKKRKNIFKRH